MDPGVSMDAGAADRQPIRVVVADDQRLVREGLRMMLSLLDGVEVVAVAASRRLRAVRVWSSRWTTRDFSNWPARSRRPAR
jgi:hypothetical protein